ncbi:transmembrane channel-like protein 6 isoform X3 [Lepidochelys kempii]|uniref:transmembrane channel-like protein 6 isoform X3 n=1 Tax=Lepidochelys kempii TaxID=8472 RepID=UPI003C701FF7
MTQPFSFTLCVPESRDGASPDLSLGDEGAMHSSFQELLREQELQELQELTVGGRENLAHGAAAAGRTEVWEEPEPRGEHPDFSSATLQILARMPSRTIGHSRGAIISQCYNRTTKLRRRNSQPPLHQASRSARPSLRQYDLELDAGRSEQEDTHSLLVKELQTLSSSQRNHILQAMPVSLAEKRSLRSVPTRDRGSSRQELGGHRSTLRKPERTRWPLSCCGQLKHDFITGFRSLWDGFLSLLHSLQPWHQSLKQIGGRFGSSVLSYFLFLKTLLTFNAFLFLTFLIFVVATQARYPPAAGNSRLFTGLELLTGAVSTALEGETSETHLLLSAFPSPGAAPTCPATPRCSGTDRICIPCSAGALLPAQSQVLQRKVPPPCNRAWAHRTAAAACIGFLWPGQGTGSQGRAGGEGSSTTTAEQHPSWCLEVEPRDHRDVGLEGTSRGRTKKPETHLGLSSLFLKPSSDGDPRLPWEPMQSPPALQLGEAVGPTPVLSLQGYFTQTLMYYGYYSNFTLNDPCTPSCGRCQPGKGHLPYNMPLAYVFTIGVSFFSTCILLVYSMSRSFGESYRVGSTSGHFAMKVFCAWDYKVIQRRSVRLQNENIRTQLKELLGEWQSKSRPLSLCRRLGRMVVLSLAWALSLGTVLGCVIAVYYLSEHLLKVHRDSRDGGSSEARQEAFLLVLPMVVSLMNLVMPYLYNLLAAWEKQESPALEVYVAICRNLILKMVVLGLLCYHWLSRKRGYYLEDECWETSVGQELYRFVVMDFVFTLLDTFLGELLWRLILEKKLMRKQRPEFDIARNVLELIYGQTLTWLGVLFCPLLPAIQILKLVLLFYIKKTSLMKNCQSPSKPWRASHMSTVFITLLCFPSFLGAAIFLSYTIWAVRPSKTCGPFRMQETIYESGKTWVQELEKCSPNIAWFTWIHKHLVGNTFFLFFVSGVLLAVIYLHIQVVKGQRRIIRLLKEQIANEGEDKVFLIQRLQCIYGKQETHPCVPGRKELNA